MPKDKPSKLDLLKECTQGKKRPSKINKAFIRPENEDDDGYDPFSDRKPEPEPLFDSDPWE